MGLSLPFRGATLKAQGAPIDVIVAEEGTGWEMQVGAIMKNTKNLEDSKTFMDWIVSQEAMNVYGTRNEVTALPVSVAKHQHMPPGIETKLIKNDFEWAAKDLSRIVAEWRRRYDAKSEPKK